MIQELLYTSHDDKGLRQGGGGGFCTVLSTIGMATNLAGALEQLSGYKHPFDIHDARSANNPVNFRHTVIRVGGITYHVLSRIADLRREHTGRSNKLAHHVAITKDALPIGGPSILFSESGVCRSNWDGQVTLVPEIPISALPKQDMPFGPCRTWQKVTGDAGWAGAVAEHLLTNRQVPFSTIAPLDTDSLALVSEVLAILPPQDRWSITFSTYFTSLPAGTSCALRFLLDGTQEAEQLRRDYRQKFIDLTTKLAAPADSELVTLARTGKRQAIATKSALGQRGDAVEATERGAEVGAAAGRNGPNSRNRQHQPSSAFGNELELEPPIKRSSHPLGDLNLEDGYQRLSTPRQASRSKGIWIGVAVAASLMLVMALVGGSLFAWWKFAGGKGLIASNTKSNQKKSVESENAPPSTGSPNKSAHSTASSDTSVAEKSPPGVADPQAPVEDARSTKPSTNPTNATSPAEPASTQLPPTAPENQKSTPAVHDNVHTINDQTPPQTDNSPAKDVTVPPFLDIPRLPLPKKSIEPFRIPIRVPGIALCQEGRLYNTSLAAAPLVRQKAHHRLRPRNADNIGSHGSIA